MRGRQIGHGRAVANDGGKIRRQAGCADVHHGDADRADGLLNGLIFNAGNNAITLPVSQPRRRQIAATLLGQVNGPLTVLAHKRADTVKQFAGIAVRGFNQQRHRGPRSLGARVFALFHR
jgi:hypothetical protein